MVGSYLLRLRHNLPDNLLLPPLLPPLLPLLLLLLLLLSFPPSQEFSDIFIDPLAQKFRASRYSRGEPIDWTRSQSEACHPPPTPPTATPTQVFFTPPPPFFCTRSAPMLDLSGRRGSYHLLSPTCRRRGGARHLADVTFRLRPGLSANPLRGEGGGGSPYRIWYRKTGDQLGD